jgi:plastocyanin
MTNSKLLLAAQALATVGFVLILIPLIPYLEVPPSRFGLYAIAMSTAAFFVARREPSILVSGLLIATGIIIATPSVTFFVSALPSITGSIIGVAFGTWILALGIRKSVTTAKLIRGKTPFTDTIRDEIKKNTLGVTRLAALFIAIAVIVIGGALALYVLPSSFSGSSCTSSSQSSAPSPIVNILIYSGAASSSNPPGYSPDNVTLVIGVNNTVTWTNHDSAAHTVTSSIYPACGFFDSGNMGSGATYTHTFTVSGTYQYYCKYHSWMTGAIVVKAGS